MSNNFLFTFSAFFFFMITFDIKAHMNTWVLNLVVRVFEFTYIFGLIEMFGQISQLVRDKANDQINNTSDDNVYCWMLDLKSFQYFSVWNFCHKSRFLLRKKHGVNEKCKTYLESIKQQWDCMKRESCLFGDIHKVCIQGRNFFFS